MYDVVFCYAFSHLKSERGLEKLLQQGFHPKVIVASPWKKIRASRPDTTALPPRKSEKLFHLAEENKIPVLVADIRSAEVAEFLTRIRPHMGVILGARVIPPKLIDLFSRGIVNAHPGLLPHNRGLNSLEHAVLRKLPQGVSLHYINSEIDAGKFIASKVLDLGERLQVDSVRSLSLSVQIELLTSASLVESNQTSDLSGGHVNPPLTTADLELFQSRWPKYLKDYDVIREQYMDRYLRNKDEGSFEQ